MPTEVFRNPPGNAEQHVQIAVRLTGEPIAFDQSCLDKAGRKRLAKAAADKEWVAVKGIATVSWRSEEDCDKCLANQKKRGRYQRISEYASRIGRGEYPDFGHVYLHPSLTGRENLEVIDGTRRLLAYLEAGQHEMPVVVLIAAGEPR
jgi:hypothetical protein